MGLCFAMPRAIAVVEVIVIECVRLFKQILILKKLAGGCGMSFVMEGSSVRLCLVPGMNIISKFVFKLQFGGHSKASVVERQDSPYC
jgi:hypothetical protein